MAYHLVTSVICPSTLVLFGKPLYSVSDILRISWPLGGGYTSRMSFPLVLNHQPRRNKEHWQFLISWRLEFRWSHKETLIGTPIQELFPVRILRFRRVAGRQHTMHSTYIILISRFIKGKNSQLYGSEVNIARKMTLLVKRLAGKNW